MRKGLISFLFLGLALVISASALAELDANEYTYDEEADRYILNNSDALYQKWYDVYLKFSEWLARWEV